MSARNDVKNVSLKRAYEPPTRSDGTRILIDRLWPRGIKKEEAKIDEWMKTISPTTELRTWFGHDPARWSEFRRRYKAELRRHPKELERLRTLARKGPLTLIFAARDEAHNDAVVVKELLVGRRRRKLCRSRGRRSVAAALALSRGIEDGITCIRHLSEQALGQGGRDRRATWSPAHAILARRLSKRRSGR